MNKEAIIPLLKADARLNDAQLATSLGVTEAEVCQARAELEKEGRIRGYQVIINDDEDEGHVYAFIEVRCTPQRGDGFNRLARRVARFEEVRSCYLISGGYDLLVLMESNTLPAVGRFVSEKLSNIDGVLSTATHFRLKTYKKDDVLFEDDIPHERLIVSP